MSSIEDQIRSARTIEDVVNLLTILFTNLNNQNEIYYDMFLNPEPMDLELERYDENGELVTVTLPNRAKDLISTYSGAGSPNGVLAANVGATYIDTVNRAFYYKSYGSDAYGWVLVWSTSNLVENVDFLSPTGSGAQLSNLNANNISSGVVAATRGGTGATNLRGIVRGNGTTAFTEATDGIDFMGPISYTGIICSYPVYNTNLDNNGIPYGWLICDGAIYNTTLRPELMNLKNKLGSNFGGDGITTFGVPNLIDRYIKQGIANVGATGSASVGAHGHTATGSTTSYAGDHTHTRGTMNITGAFSGHDSASGAFWVSGGSEWHGNRNNNGQKHQISFDASRSWSGVTSTAGGHTHSVDISISSAGSGTNEVDRMILVPIIKF